jgi:hypothetical protein
MYERYFSEGGTDGSARQYMIQAKSMSGDNAGALKETRAEIQAAEKAGRVPSQTTLEAYAFAVQKSDKVAYLATLEKLVMHYGKKEYWVNLLNSVERKSEFSSRLSMDLYRLKLAVGQVSKTSDYMEMAQMAIQDGNAAEAVKIIDQGYKAGALGTGTEAARHGRLKDLAAKRVAEAKAGLAAAESAAEKSADGTALVNLGFSLATGGEYDKGISLMEQGIKKGSLKYPDDADLHLGVAHLLAGKKAAGVKILKTVKGKDGTAELARFWVIYASQAK